MSFNLFIGVEKVLPLVKYRVEKCSDSSHYCWESFDQHELEQCRFDLGQPAQWLRKLIQEISSPSPFHEHCKCSSTVFSRLFNLLLTSFSTWPPFFSLLARNFEMRSAPNSHTAPIRFDSERCRISVNPTPLMRSMFTRTTLFHFVTSWRHHMHILSLLNTLLNIVSKCAAT